jgi:hypothetical protein
MGFSYHRLDCLVKDRYKCPIRARMFFNAKANCNGSRTDSARLMASLVLSRARNGPARAVQSTFYEIEMELVDVQPQTFEVKLDREFLY